VGHADKAIASFQMAISEAKGHSSAAQQQRALTFSNLGAAFRKTGQLADARSVLSESLGLMLAQSGVDKAILANAHREKALVHEALKEPEAAFKEFEAALQLYSSADSATSFSKELSQCAYSMAMIAHRGKELSKAQPLYAAALKHARAGFTDKHANVAEIQSRWVVAVRVRSVTGSHVLPGVVGPLCSLGSLYMDRQDYTAAREAYHDSMLIFKVEPALALQCATRSSMNCVLFRPFVRARRTCGIRVWCRRCRTIWAR
jgi:tetratricopeptide (TPR) repeat protein